MVTHTALGLAHSACTGPVLSRTTASSLPLFSHPCGILFLFLFLFSSTLLFYGIQTNSTQHTAQDRGNGSCCVRTVGHTKTPAPPAAASESALSAPPSLAARPTSVPSRTG